MSFSKISTGNKYSWESHLPNKRLTFILFLSCFAFGLVVYGFDLFVFTFSIDEEVNTFLSNLEKSAVMQGRWGLYILMSLFSPIPIVPVVSQLIQLTALSASYVIISIAWQKDIGVAHFAAAPFAIGFPTLVHLMGFSHIANIVMLGLAFSSLSLFLINAAGWRGTLLAIPILTLAFAIYQPIILYTISSCIVLVGLSSFNLKIKDLFRTSLAFAGAIVVSILFYFIVLKIWLHIIGLENKYIDHFVKINLLMSNTKEIVQRTAMFGSAMLLGTSDIFPGRLILIGPTLVLGAVLAWWNVGCRTALVLGAAILVPLGAPLFSGGDLPYRTLLALPIALAGLIFVAARSRSHLRTILVILSAYCALHFALIGNRLYYASYLAWLNDRALANRVIMRIEALEFRPSPVILEVVGIPKFATSPQRPVVRSSTLGASFFQWDGGNPSRIKLFLKTMGYEVELISHDQRLAMYKKVNQMPRWPALESVRLVDGVVVVKFSDYTAEQRNRDGLP